MILDQALLISELDFLDHAMAPEFPVIFDATLLGCSYYIIYILSTENEKIYMHIYSHTHT